MLVPLIDVIIPFTVWHWVILGLVLISLEMALGTYDLLFVSLASFVTAVFAAILPETKNNWQSQSVIFVVISVVFVVIGRVFFTREKGDALEHPTLNKRMQRLIGSTGIAEADFIGGAGRVKIGDTTWLAESDDRAFSINAGTVLEVVSAQNTTVRVKPV